MDPDLEWIFGLSDDELQQIFLLSEERSARVEKLIQKEFAQACSDSVDALAVMRDEAFGLYWRRIIDTRDRLSEEDVNELLHQRLFPTAKCLLGDAIIRNKVSLALCDKVLKNSDEKSWLYLQAKAYLLLSSIETCLSKEALQELFTLRCDWALHRVFDRLDDVGVPLFSELLESNETLYKKDRNRWREKIKQRKKQFRNRG